MEAKGETVEDWMQRPRPLDTRLVDPMDYSGRIRQEPRARVWIKADGTLPDDPLLHQCVAAYASDMTLLDTSVRPHAIPWTHPRFQSASLDHAMWFHRPFRADEWLLYVQDSPSASGARGLNRGLIYDQDGALVASAAQEGLIRVHDGD